MKRSRSIRLDEEDEALFARAVELSPDDNVSVWLRRVGRVEAQRTIQEHEQTRPKKGR
jgi:hypothetical protein